MLNISGYYGATPPVSTLLPQPAEIEAFHKLEKYLHERNDIYVLDDNIKLRNLIIQQLNDILVEWSIFIGKEKEIPNDYTVNGGGIQVHIFGSTSLGVNTPDSDIDVLCIAPYYITRIDFFTSFVNRLLNLPEVTMLSSIPEAYTPVIKFNLNGLAIDMIFASLTTIPYIPNDIDLLDNKHLIGLDEQSIRSLNGVRVAKQLIKLIPNYPNFQIALRAIKHWARQRSIYSNVLGFLGGINYAILVAYVCQNYPNANPATLIRKFFYIYNNWNWKNPILLNHIDENIYIENIYIWNPKKNIKDSLHIMPIITPTYPAMNSSYNVTLPQFRIIIEEIKRGEMLFNIHDIEIFPWSELFSSIGSDFYVHDKYIQIDITALLPDDHRKWFGWIESRLRTLILNLDNPPYLCSYPQANCYHRQIPINISEQLVDNRSDHFDINTIDKYSDLVDSSVDMPTTPNKSTISTTSSFSMNSNGTELLYISTFFIGLKYVNNFFDINPIIQDFIYRVKLWPTYKSTMDIIIKQIDNASLPSFINDVKAEPSNANNCTPKKLSSDASSNLTSITNNISITSSKSRSNNVINNISNYRKNIDLTHRNERTNKSFVNNKQIKYEKINKKAYNHSLTDSFAERIVNNNQNVNSTKGNDLIMNVPSMYTITENDTNNYVNVNTFVPYHVNPVVVYTVPVVPVMVNTNLKGNINSNVMTHPNSGQASMGNIIKEVNYNNNGNENNIKAHAPSQKSRQITEQAPAEEKVIMKVNDQTKNNNNNNNSSTVTNDNSNGVLSTPTRQNSRRLDSKSIGQIGKHLGKQFSDNQSKSIDKLCDRQLFISKSTDSIDSNSNNRKISASNNSVVNINSSSNNNNNNSSSQNRVNSNNNLSNRLGDNKAHNIHDTSPHKKHKKSSVHK